MGPSADTQLYTAKRRHCQQGRGRRSQSNQLVTSVLLVLRTRPHAPHGGCSRVGAAHGRLALVNAHTVDSGIINLFMQGIFTLENPIQAQG